MTEPASLRPVPPETGHRHGPDCDHGHDDGHDRGHDHGHGGGHHHAPEVSARNERLVLTAFFITSGFMVVSALAPHRA